MGVILSSLNNLVRYQQTWHQPSVPPPAQADRLYLGRHHQRLVFQVSGQHLDMLPTDEIERTTVGYRQILSGLPGPLQIVIRRRPLEMAAYWQHLEQCVPTTYRHLADYQRQYFEYLLHCQAPLTSQRYLVVTPTQPARSPLKR